MAKRIVTALLAAAVAAIPAIMAAPTASAAEQWPTYTTVIHNVAAFDRSNYNTFRIKIKARDAYNGPVESRVTLFINGKYQRSKMTDWGWREFLIGRNDLPNNKVSRVTLFIDPVDPRRKPVTLHRWVYDTPPKPVGQKVVDAARTQKGDRYRLGATGPNVWDCSSLTRFAVQEASGKKLPRTSAQQSRTGREVPRSQAKPGDLLYTPGHIAVYAGNGKVVEAATPKTGVVERNAWQRNPRVIRVVE